MSDDVKTTTMSDAPQGCGCPHCMKQEASGETYSDPQEIGTTPFEGKTGNILGGSRLLSGSTWGGDGTGITLTYRFWDTLPSYYDSGDQEASNFRVFSNQMEEATVRVMDMLETFTNITFVEATGADSDVHLGFAQTQLPSGTGAWAYYPTTHPKGGDVWTNHLVGGTVNPEEGNYGFYTIMHEIGHALGLQHSFEELTGEHATSKYSVMAYDWDAYFSASYMMYDISALQELYGANLDHNLGDDVYTLDNNLAYTVWDAGGNDTFDASAQTIDVTLDLKEGSFSTVGIQDNIAIAFLTVIENATGGSGNDTIYGNDADNILIGNAGDDTFYGSAGNDTMDGGDGTDTVIYDIDLYDLTVEIVNSTTLRFYQTIFPTVIDTLISIESFILDTVSYTLADILDYANMLNPIADVTGTHRADVMNADAGDNFYAGAGGHDTMRGYGGNDRLDGNAGNDRLYGGDGDDTLNGDDGSDRIWGDAGNDTINGGDGQDRLYGDDGDDFINGGNDKDRIYGGDGDDTINGDGGVDRIWGGNGNDIINGGVNRDDLRGEGGDDYIIGGDGNDTLWGGDGNDEILGDVGNDKIFGEDGNDILDGNNGNDNINGGLGNDIITGGTGDDVAAGMHGDDIIDGGDGNDRIYGGNDNDTLTGGNGNDLLNGGLGDDIIDGGAGSDTLYGGRGRDTFVLDAADDGSTIIQAFDAAEDFLDLSDVLENYDAATEQIGDFIELANVGANTFIGVSESGSGAGYQILAQINGANGLTAEDLEDSGVLVY